MGSFDSRKKPSLQLQRESTPRLDKVSSQLRNMAKGEHPGWQGHQGLPGRHLSTHFSLDFKATLEDGLVHKIGISPGVTFTHCPSSFSCDSL